MIEETEPTESSELDKPIDVLKDLFITCSLSPLFSVNEGVRTKSPLEKLYKLKFSFKLLFIKTKLQSEYISFDITQDNNTQPNLKNKKENVSISIHKISQIVWNPNNDIDKLYDFYKNENIDIEPHAKKNYYITTQYIIKFDDVFFSLSSDEYKELYDNYVQNKLYTKLALAQLYIDEINESDFIDIDLDNPDLNDDDDDDDDE